MSSVFFMCLPDKVSCFQQACADMSALAIQVLLCLGYIIDFHVTEHC